ncbi:MAG: hypothetical protein KDE22_12635 [Rhodobacterales bacterium]|nr:hypothetical protein [Rhodobacterales bacterium]
MKKGLIVGGGAILAIIVVVVVVVGYVLANLGDLIKQAVETMGPEITKASVTLDKADISATEGSGYLEGLVVGNPAGFKTDSAFRLGKISLVIDTDSITSDPVVVKEVVIQSPQVTYELGDGGSNIDALKRNVDAYAKSLGAGGGGSGESSGEGKKVVIENLYVRGGRVNVSAALLQGKSMGADLPDLHLTDIGKDKGGASPAEVAKQVMDKLTQGIGTAIGSLNLDEVLGGLKDKAGAIGDTLKEGGGAVTEQLKGGGGAVTDGLKGGADKAGKALKGLLGN